MSVQVVGVSSAAWLCTEPSDFVSQHLPVPVGPPCAPTFTWGFLGQRVAVGQRDVVELCVCLDAVQDIGLEQCLHWSLGNWILDVQWAFWKEQHCLWRWERAPSISPSIESQRLERPLRSSPAFDPTPCCSLTESLRLERPPRS